MRWAAPCDNRRDGLGIADRIEWRGARAQDDVIAAYLESDLFVLAARVARSGDRDGLPNVLMEAQALGLPCLAADVSGVPELLDDGVTGRLVAPDSPDALATALRDLMSDPGQRARLADAGLSRVRRDFAFERGLDRLAGKFGLTRDAAA